MTDRSRPCNELFGRVAVFPLPRQQGTFAAIARRADLDAALLDVARAAGVKVYDGHGVTGVRATDHVALEGEGIGPIGNVLDPRFTSFVGPAAITSESIVAVMYS